MGPWRAACHLSNVSCRAHQTLTCGLPWSSPGRKQEPNRVTKSSYTTSPSTAKFPMVLCLLELAV
eukprot:3023699-Amphidinium_carterae.1